MVYRVFVEKKQGLDLEASALLADAKTLLNIKSLQKVRVFNRYDAENISEELFAYAKKTVFSEPQTDLVSDAPDVQGAYVFAVEYLPGQFDQRADSAAQCIQIISRGERPLVRSAKVYALYGSLSESEINEIKNYVINPVEARLAEIDKPETLSVNYEIPTAIETLEGFTAKDEAGLSLFLKERGLAMDIDDIKFCREYFAAEKRDPTVTEIRMIDTYWSDHCRHTTFGTIIDEVSFLDENALRSYEKYLAVRKETGRENKPVCLMDLATIAVKNLRKRGLLDKLDESEEINACTVKTEVTVDGKKEPWLLLFKNETHNHPTEIEPFGGAATCIGGAIRDPLSGRAYVYGAMRLTGAADPLAPVSETVKGKLPQRKIVTTAAAGYSSYGNQIGLATGIVDEIYHPGYLAKRMEIGAVIAAAPEKNVRRERPSAGDVIILLGGATGRDGCGGATGSSKSHTIESLSTCGAEVQKGNAPEERKLQRLFRNPVASRMIKRCNDFGAGGVSVAIGELADGLDINLGAVPKKYEGLDGTELAISESQERMAVVVAAEDKDAFLALAADENLQATEVARVTDENRLVMRWNGKVIVDIKRDFLNSNGAEKHAKAVVVAPKPLKREISGTFEENMIAIAGDLNVCSKRGLSERFDSTIGAGTVLMPFGGKYQRTPVQAMVQKISVEKGHTDDCSFMAWGFDPFVSENDPYRGAYIAVISSICKLVASGAEFSDVYLSFQEYFERLGDKKESWGKPLAALLGAFEAQMRLGVGAIGGKDSMSGSFENIHVPPTLVSFAVTTGRAGEVVSPEYKKAGDKVVMLKAKVGKDGLIDADHLKNTFDKITALMRSGKVLSAYTLTMGGVAEAVMKCSFGNGYGFKFNDALTLSDIFSRDYGSFLLEIPADQSVEGAEEVGTITEEKIFAYQGERVSFTAVETAYEEKLEPVFPCNTESSKKVDNVRFTGDKRYTASYSCARPKVLIPAFPGTNCEYDSAKAVADAGAEPEIFVVKNLDAESIKKSVEDFAKAVKTSQIIFIPGGFSGGDEPDGSGKFITAFFRNAAIKEAVTELLGRRDGLMCGICNGFQALIKLGLVPYGKIIDTDENCPTLTFNTIARHQSKIVKTRIASNMSPWLAQTKVGEVYNVPISHGEGRFIASSELIKTLAENGQIATQYCDLSGNASAEIQFNPNGSDFAIEGITSPDGRVFGKMGHSERIGANLYENVPGNYDVKMFSSAVKYFKK